MHKFYLLYIYEFDKVYIPIYSPKPPIQHFAASKSGVFKIKAFDFASYVAVVLIPFAFVPWDISVSAKQQVY